MSGPGREKRHFVVRAEDLWAADMLDAEDAPDLTEDQFNRLVAEIQGGQPRRNPHRSPRRGRKTGGLIPWGVWDATGSPGGPVW